MRKYITHKDQRMHRVRTDVPCEGDSRLLENVYEHYTDRTYYLFGKLPIWFRVIDVERRPIHEFINRACGG